MNGWPSWRWLVPLAALGCGAQEPVPDDLVDPLVGLFADFASRDAETWASAVLAWALAQDPDAPLASRTFAPAALDPERVRLADGTDVAATRFAVGVLASSPHDVDDHRRASLLPDATCVEPPWTRSWTRTSDATTCWTLGSCRDAVADSDIVDVTDAGTLSWSMHEELARIEAALDPETDTDVWIRRWWATAPAQATGAGDGLDRAYGLRMWVADPDDLRHTWRLDVTWADLHLAGQDEDATRAALVQAIADGQDATDTWLDAGLTACPDGGTP
ncbi:MAG: hypothetical protein H6733_05630 [Alphaproteobacteria bacterium]|nr:hypothetical protein [Alphaproteobacteria bacterium]